MSSREISLISILTGIVAGLASSFPYELEIGTSLFLWVVLGLVLGRLSLERSVVLNAGAFYGVSLALSFLFFSIGGMHSGIVSYSLLVLLMSLIGGIFGTILLLAGSESKKRLRLVRWSVQGVLYVVQYVRDRYNRLYHP